MKSLRFLITAGPTREFLDPIRFLSNRSSGKMGFAVAAAARKLSERVVLVSGPVSLTPPAGVEFVPVTSAQEMAEAVWSRFDDCDIVVMTAAVCDWRPRQTASGKIKKNHAGMVMELEATPDILAELGRRKSHQILVGFAAETENVEAQARGKLDRKRLDLVVANDASAFDADASAVTFIHGDGRVERLPRLAKSEVAERIIEEVRRRTV